MASFIFDSAQWSIISLCFLISIFATELNLLSAIKFAVYLALSISPLYIYSITFKNSTLSVYILSQYLILAELSLFSKPTISLYSLSAFPLVPNSSLSYVLSLLVQSIS